MTQGDQENLLSNDTLVENKESSQPAKPRKRTVRKPRTMARKKVQTPAEDETAPLKTEPLNAASDAGPENDDGIANQEVAPRKGRRNAKTPKTSRSRTSKSKKLSKPSEKDTLGSEDSSSKDLQVPTSTPETASLVSSESTFTESELSDTGWSNWEGWKELDYPSPAEQTGVEQDSADNNAPTVTTSDTAFHEQVHAGGPDVAQDTVTDNLAAEETVQVAESEQEDLAETEEQDAHRKRRRRGRRGGRGRAHKTLSENAAESFQDAENSESDANFVPFETVEEFQEQPTPRVSNAKRRMYISVLTGEQVEVAITNNALLEEYYLDMLHQKKIKGNIYRGVIHNIDSNLQAAFVDFGEEKNGFLQIDEIHPEYYLAPHEAGKGKKYPPIQRVLRIGQEVLVQVVKEPNGSKGAFLTTWISLAGRFLVLTPGQEQIGISRKVVDDEERQRLREMMAGIDPGDDLGVIVRTVSAGVTRSILQNDLTYLKRTWAEVRRHATEVSAPACVYKEPGLPERAVRDYLTDDVCEIWVDNTDIAERIKTTVALLFPNKKDLVRLHTDARHSMWERFNLRRQLDQIYSREVLMPSGGRLCFDQTEALMAIDINSGKISGKGNFEAMAFRTNMEAAETIARQLKLRDVGGQVVIDFIEMKDHKHVVEVERTLRTAMKYDRARHDIGHMSSFGLLELVRQRTGTSAISISMEPCPVCGGTGLRRNLEWQSLQALRDLRRILRARTTSPCQYEAPQELGLYLLNHKRDSLKELETDFNKSIEIVIKA